jgi:outer membrane immunogenic protein
MEDVMRKTILALTVASAALASSAAVAADVMRGPSAFSNPVPVSTYNWTGPYLGLNGGYEWGKITNAGNKPSGFEGGLQAGYNWQFGQFVFGAETDIQVTGGDDTFAPYKFSNPWFGTLRGRAGYALNNILFYGTFGLAYGEIKGELGTLDESQTHVGWAGGLGMEVGFTPNWSARVEYLYMDLGTRPYAITGANNGLDANILRFGVNYRF